ncbi:MAG: MFS transporter, partial [Burkholderiaceae bacterium]
MTSPRPLPRAALVNLYLVAGLYFCTGAFTMQFPRYILKMGGTAQAAGWLIAIGLLPTLFLGPALGDWVRRIGTRKPIQLGLGLAIVANLLMLSVDSIGPWMIFIRLVAAFGHTIVSVTLITSAAMLVDHPVQRAQVIGWLAVVIQIGNAIGGLVGELAYQAGNFWYWSACAMITFVVVVLSMWSSVRFAAPVETTDQNSQNEVVHVGWPLELWALGAVGMAFAGLSQFMPTYIEYLGKTGALQEVFAAAWFLTPALLVIASVRLVGGYFAAKLLRPSILMTCHGLLLATIILLPWIHSRTEAVILAIFFGLSYGWLYPALSSLAFTRVAAAARGRVSGRLVIAFELGYRLGPIGLGALITNA